MARRLYDPLAGIPSPDAVRRKLAEVETVAARLRRLLAAAECAHTPAPVQAGPGPAEVVTDAPLAPVTA